MVKPQLAFRLAILVVFSLLISPAVYATQSDIDKERRWAEQIIDSLLDGEELWLADSDGHRFFNLFTPGDGNLEGAAVLVHGIGVHPNWPDVIYPLRAGLLEDGVATLSVQMPILANDADPGDYQPLFAEVPGRLDAAVNWLLAAGYKKIVLIAHSMGASMTTYYLSRSQAPALDSVILIGMGPGGDGRQNIDNLAKIKIPVFDLYGESDLDPVLNSAPRRAAAKAGLGAQAYRQAVAAGANHFWQGSEAELLSYVRDWLGNR